MANKTSDKLERLILDKTLNKLRPIIAVNRPAKGWVRTIRESLGMGLTQLAKRAGVVQSRVYKIESDEVENKITLSTLENMAKALNCKLFYVLIPEKPLQTMLEEQAEKIVLKQSKNVSHSMELEDQKVDDERLKDFVKVQVEDLLQKRLGKIWEDG